MDTPRKKARRKTALESLRKIYGVTPNGYDPAWIEAINNALNGRESNIRILDITEGLWDNYIGPMIDAIEDDLADYDDDHLVVLKQ